MSKKEWKLFTAFTVKGGGETLGILIFWHICKWGNVEKH